MSGRRRLRTAVLVVALGALLVPVAAAGATRTTGSEPLDDVLEAAAIHARCDLEVDELAAIMLAPTFPETGAPASRAPSPMTLSRYDNQSALYSFGDPDTYREAFWHPGVGQWQFDEAGGWGMTAAARIDARSSALKAADVMATRWCANPSLAYVWAPWFGCGTTTCQAIFDDIYDGTALRNLEEEAVEHLAGMQERTCVLANRPESVPCWYVDPAAAQGYGGFALPQFGLSPVSAPFYSYELDGEEQRHWAPIDSTFTVPITADLPQGLNSRTSLTWEKDTALCDITLGRGICDPVPIDGAWLRIMAVSGTYRPLVGDFDGDGRDDLFLYAAGAPPDFVFFGRPGNSWAAFKVTVNGTYEPLVGDFDGDGLSDVLWYAAGPAADAVWWGRADGSFASTPNPVGGTYVPVLGDFDGDGADDVLWYRAGAGADYLSSGTPLRSFHTQPLGINGAFTPLPGDFDGDGFGDVLWYAPGPANDFLWLGRARGIFESRQEKITNEYVPQVGDFDGDGRDDVYLYRPGTGTDWLFAGTVDETFDRVASVINGTYVVTVGDLDGDLIDDLLLYRPGELSDYVYRGSVERLLSAVEVQIDGTYLPVIGDYNGAGGDDVFWYRPGPEHDAVWYAPDAS